MHLEFPEIHHKKMWEKMIQEWKSVEKIPTSPSALFRWENFNTFLKIAQRNTTSNSVWVNAHLFFCIKDEEIVWAIDIRHHINHPNLIESWGHIWYGIAPKFRRKGYATKMLGLGLIEAKKLWCERVLIICAVDNIASNKVILNNGGVFERKTKDGKDNRYWVGD